MSKEHKFVYGPVPSRRLGLSLGIDVVPFKVCSYDCLYCQLGRTKKKTIERQSFFNPKEILSEVREYREQGGSADYFTVSGSGEPTLYSDIGEVVEGLKTMSDIPAAVITNGSLLWQKEVQNALLSCDLIVPSLDSASEASFRYINEPAPGLELPRIISGLADFCSKFKGRVWLEIMLLDGVNTSPEELGELKKAVERINPERVQLNTPVRPTRSGLAKPVDIDTLRSIAAVFGDKVEVIATFKPKACAQGSEADDNRVLGLLKRRPCRVWDLAAALSVSPLLLEKALERLERQGCVHHVRKDGELFFTAD
jgi:wyosine [tRNA(Phe)-imidazoG37] synthetase (radical SAM superfamily)